MTTLPRQLFKLLLRFSDRQDQAVPETFAEKRKLLPPSGELFRDGVKMFLRNLRLSLSRLQLIECGSRAVLCISDVLLGATQAIVRGV